MNGYDYQYQLKYHNRKIKQLNNQVRKRLESLVVKHPNAIIDNESVSNLLTPNLIKALDVSDCIIFIIKIEKWIENQHPHKQLNIDFN